MSKEYQSIHEVCQDLTNNLAAHPTTAFDAHDKFMHLLGGSGLDYDTYLRTAITSGGYRRDAAYTSAEVSAKNSSAAQLAEYWLAITGEINPNVTWNATSLGYIPEYEQSDYLTFCYLGILRPERKMLATVESAFHSNLAQTAVNLSLMNSHEPNHVRLSEYLNFTDAFWMAMQDTDLRPVDRMVGLFDSDVSLGGIGEAHLAQRAGIRSNTAHYSEQDVLSAATKLSAFANSLHTLKSLGVQEIS